MNNQLEIHPKNPKQKTQVQGKKNSKENGE